VRAEHFESLLFGGSFDRYSKEYLEPEELTDIFYDFFKAKENEAMKVNGAQKVKIRKSNTGTAGSDEDFWSVYYTDKSTTLPELFVGDNERVEWLLQHDDVSVSTLNDPRYEFLVSELQGNPVRFKDKLLALIQHVEDSLMVIRSPLVSVTIAKEFHSTLDWCLSNINEHWLHLEEADRFAFTTPTIDIVIEKCVELLVSDFKRGDEDRYEDILYGGGWEEWDACTGSSCYFIPYMICDVDNLHWP